MRRKLKIIAIFLFCLISGYAAGAFTYLIRFPSEISLTEFTTHKLNIGLPLWATFHETAAVSKVNDVPMNKNGINMRLGRPLTIYTDSYGTAKVTIEAFGLPLRRITLDILPEVEVIPMGHAIGVRINTDGVMVLNTGSFLGADGETHRPAHNILNAGDLILYADEAEIKNKEFLNEYIAGSKGEVVLKISRDGEEIEVNLKPEVAAKDDVRRIGVWVRDSTRGIGTLTFYNPKTGEFGALGHGILDVDTKMLLSVRSGNIMPSKVVSVNRGMRGLPGELEGEVDSIILGAIKTNCSHGIFGEIDEDMKEKYVKLPQYPIARRAQIQEGVAAILTNVSGTEVKEYEIKIESINTETSDETKGIVIRITDPVLLEKTGGIVQGMSGSPIIQNGRLIGAITHVFVQDPTKGYAIFVDSMIRYCPESNAAFTCEAA
jgi:stage IV sporulation protein B